MDTVTAQIRATYTPILNYRHTVNETLQRLKRIFLVNTCFLVLPSYVLHYYLGVDVNSLFAALAVMSLVIALHESKGKLTQEVVSLALALCVIGSIGSLFSGAYSQILMAATLSLNLIVASCAWRLFADRRALGYLTIIGWLLIAGAIFAFLYAFAGNGPVTTIDLLGRESHFYLTTFTNAVSGNLIRAAGIFDEPGALAMFVTLIVALNEALGVNTKWSAALLFGGLITGSFALFFVAVAYVIFKGQQGRFLLLTVLAISIGSLLATNERASALATKFFFERIEIVDGRLAGDNRTHQVESFFKLVDWNMTLKGQKATGADYEGRDLSSNPFSIYFGYGVFIWIPYLAIEIWLLYCSFFYRPQLRFAAFALFMILLQRPYIYSLYWGMMIAVLLVTIYRVQRSNRQAHKPSASPRPIRLAASGLR